MNTVAKSIPSNMVAYHIFTNSAAAKGPELKIEEENSEQKLRDFVQGGGCSGFTYEFKFEEVANEDDTKTTKNRVSVLINPMSYHYLVGAEIDYRDDLDGAQFVIKNNPTATSACGCESSFSD